MALRKYARVPFHSEIAIDLPQLDMVDLNPLVFIGIDAIFERSSEILVSILVHCVVVILFGLPPKKGIKREPATVRCASH